jgi:hypothetical protein
MRARSIKPGFFKNEKLAECPALARILFEGLWCMADRAGRLEDRPKRIKAEVLPYDSCNVERHLKTLATSGFILRYAINGERYIQVLSFAKHQTPHVKEVPSTIPAPDQHQTSTMQTQDQHPLTPDCLLLTPDSGLLTPDSSKEDAAAVAHVREAAEEQERSSSTEKEPQEEPQEGTPSTPPPDPMDDDDPMDALLLELWEVPGWTRKPKDDRAELSRLGAAFPRADLAAAIQQLRAKALDGAVKANARSALQAFVKQLHLQTPEARVIEDDAPPGPRVIADWKTQAECAKEAAASARRMAAGGGA